MVASAARRRAHRAQGRELRRELAILLILDAAPGLCRGHRRFPLEHTLRRTPSLIASEGGAERGIRRPTVSGARRAQSLLAR